MHRKHLKTAVNQTLVARLAQCGEGLSETECASIINSGRDELIAQLIAILRAKNLALQTAPGGGLTPVYAVRLLARMKATQCIESMLDVLFRCDPLDILYSDLILALKSFGPPALEPVLKAYEFAKTKDRLAGIAEVLSGLGVRDQRIFSVLLRFFEKHVELGAMALAEYEDPDALPHLSKALDHCTVNSSGAMFANQTIIELAQAIIDLGGSLTESQSLKHKQATRPRVHKSGPFPLTSVSLSISGLPFDF
ncbi:MAG: hypothetical protein U0105_15265 [Candidatus Obscuribacterales bacterium]